MKYLNAFFGVTMALLGFYYVWDSDIPMGLMAISVALLHAYMFIFNNNNDDHPRFGC